MWEKIGGRKLVALILCLAATIALSVLGRLDQTTLWAILGLYTAYAGGNVGEHFAKMIASGKVDTAALSRVGDQLAQLATSPAAKEALGNINAKQLSRLSSGNATPGDAADIVGAVMSLAGAATEAKQDAEPEPKGDEYIPKSERAQPSSKPRKVGA